MYTYWVESFKNVILVYCPKRIHFADRTFEMCIALATLDWVTKKYCALKRMINKIIKPLLPGFAWIKAVSGL